MPDYRDRGLQALEQCGLKGKQDDFIWQLSGGQTHLLALAGAVSLQPEVLILDEPIAQLDPKHVDQIYAVLRELNENYGKTIIVIEHHTEYIADFCKHVMLMKDGMVQWVLPTGEALQRVEELQGCNIFPPQVTIAAHRMQPAGGLPGTIALPITVEEGKAIFAPKGLPAEEKAAFPSPKRETVAAFRDVSVSYRSVKLLQNGWKPSALYASRPIGCRQSFILQPAQIFMAVLCTKLRMATSTSWNRI